MHTVAHVALGLGTLNAYCVRMLLGGQRALTALQGGGGMEHGGSTRPLETDGQTDRLLNPRYADGAPAQFLKKKVLMSILNISAHFGSGVLYAYT